MAVSLFNTFVGHSIVFPWKSAILKSKSRLEITDWLAGAGFVHFFVTICQVTENVG